MPNGSRTVAPTRIGTAFKNMVLCCPKEVSAYGACIATHVDGIDKGVCEAEFKSLKECFRKARGGLAKK